MYKDWNPYNNHINNFPRYCQKSILCSIIILKKYRVLKDIIFMIIKMAINNWINYYKVNKL